LLIILDPVCRFSTCALVTANEMICDIHKPVHVGDLRSCPFMWEAEGLFIRLLFPQIPLVSREGKKVDPSETLNSDNVSDWAQSSVNASFL
jgi:hypothetical protein